MLTLKRCVIGGRPLRGRSGHDVNTSQEQGVLCTGSHDLPSVKDCLGTGERGNALFGIKYVQEVQERGFVADSSGKWSVRSDWKVCINVLQNAQMEK